jgi:hypothetical protein
MIHALAVAFVFVWGYNRGRAAERRAQRARDLEAGKR